MANNKKIVKEKLIKAVAFLDHSFAKAKVTVKEKLHLLDPIMIMPYYGYGNEHCVFMKERVLEKEKIVENEEGASKLRHLKNTYRRYESDEIPGARVKASYGDKEEILVTDDEGFFEVEFRFDEPIDQQKFGNKIKLELLDTKTPGDEKDAEGIIFFPNIFHSLPETKKRGLHPT